MIAPTGSIIDVTLSFVLADTGLASTAISAATAVIGTLYYFPLDGTTDKYLPVSLNTTT
jgi:hypothetical protein